jgi:hypothetical protein
MSDEQKNPFAKETWNFTEQCRYLKEHGLQAARALARAAGLDPDSDYGLGLWEDGKEPSAVKPYKPTPLDLSAAIERRFREARLYANVRFWRKPE